jgi:nitrate/TMAO reductase-like tetraheme cytochrome c subunit
LRASASAAIGALAGVGLAAAVAASFSFTSSSPFCGSCHVMSAVTSEWRDSAHYLNRSGMRAGCADCHIAPGPLALAGSKLHSLRAELLPWLRGLDTPEELEPRRELLAERVWSHLRETDSAACRACHAMPAEVLALQTPRAREMHADGEQDGQTCIDCHDDGIAHRPVKKAKPEEGEWKPEDFEL